jgi:hypothetical protein
MIVSLIVPPSKPVEPRDCSLARGFAPAAGAAIGETMEKAMRLFGYVLFAVAGVAAAEDAPLARIAFAADGPVAATPPMLCDALPAFAAWVRPAALVAAPRADMGPLPRMTMGQAAAVTLSPAQDLVPVVTPRIAGGPHAYAGLLRVHAPVAGTYRFALSGPAWLDVVDRGVSAASVAHGHGPECGPIRKLVDLPLSAGDHVVQLAAAPTPNIEIMGVRVVP